MHWNLIQKINRLYHVNVPPCIFVLRNGGCGVYQSAARSLCWCIYSPRSMAKCAQLSEGARLEWVRHDMPMACGHAGMARYLFRYRFGGSTLFRSKPEYDRVSSSHNKLQLTHAQIFRIAQISLLLAILSHSANLVRYERFQSQKKGS